MISQIECPDCEGEGSVENPALHGFRPDPADITPLPEREVNRIIERMSVAQRQCVLALSDDFQLPPHGHSQAAWSMFYGLSLTSYRYDGEAKRRVYRLTKRGLQIRVALALPTPTKDSSHA